MAIKRLTIELDDLSDRTRLTSVPEGLSVTEAKELKTRESTTVPSDKTTDETDSPMAGHAPLRATGRTVADLIAEFVNDPRAMATILMFAPFVVFVTKIQELADLKYPVFTGVLLNAVWFGVSWARRLKKRDA